MSQTNLLPRAHLRPRTSGRANMLQWEAVHSEISQTATLRQAFMQNLEIHLRNLFGQPTTQADALQRIQEADAAGQFDQATQLRANLARANQYAIVDTLRVERSPRYLAEPGKTFCNIYAYDVVTALGGYLPRVWWMDQAIARLRNGESVQPVYAETVRELNANMLTDWMYTFGPEYGWARETDITAAQAAANAGQLVVLLSARIKKSESGHVNIVLSETDQNQAVRDASGNVTRPLQSQAGATNFQYRPHPSQWWQAPGYERGAAWIFWGTSTSPLLTREQLGSAGGGLGAIAPRPPAKPRRGAVRRPRPAKPSVPAAGAREAAEHEGPFPGRRQGAGYTYDGAGSKADTIERVTVAAARYRREGDSLKAQACTVFLRLAAMEGWTSAIDTSDSRVFTWGAGFADGGMLQWMWRYLDDSVKSYLAEHPRAGRYFGGEGANITAAIRKDTGALNAVVYVSEHDPYRAHVLDAQLQAFMERAMGAEVGVARGARAASSDVNVVGLAADLAQWTPALFRLPEGLDEAVRLAGAAPGGEPDPAALAAAVILVHARRMLDSSRYGAAGPGGRRLLKPGIAERWAPILRYQRGLRELLDADRAPLAITARATELIPAFEQGSSPFFTGVADIDDLPKNHYVMVHGERYYDWGPRG